MGGGVGSLAGGTMPPMRAEHGPRRCASHQVGDAVLLARAQDLPTARWLGHGGRGKPAQRRGRGASQSWGRARVRALTR
jgi:hypothetical protein